jgi:hypothetical protein
VGGGGETSKQKTKTPELVCNLGQKWEDTIIRPNSGRKIFLMLIKYQL